MVSAEKAVEVPDIVDDYRFPPMEPPNRFRSASQKSRPKAESSCATILFTLADHLEAVSEMQQVLLTFLIIFTLGLNSSLAQNQAPPAATQNTKPAGQHDEEGEENQAPAAKSFNSSVPPNAPVITIQGLCDTPKTEVSGGTAGCKTVITRSEFEEMANTLQPGMPQQVRKQLANAYPSLLVLEKEAQKRGLEKDPHYLERMKFAKLQLLNQELNRRLEDEASKVPEKDMQDYYEKNSKNFEQAALQRLYVPRTKQLAASTNGATAADQTAAERTSEEAMAKTATELRTRAASGEDFDKLEKDAYEAGGIKSNPPTTVIPKIRRVNMPPAHAKIFDLNPGEVSQLISDPSGYYIYKVQTKSVPTFEEVKPEIHANLQNQRMREEVQKLQDSVTTQLNDAYFGPAPTSTPAIAKPATDDHKPNKADPQQ